MYAYTVALPPFCTLQQALALQFFPATLGDFLSIVSRQLLRYRLVAVNSPALSALHLLLAYSAALCDGCICTHVAFLHHSETIADFLMKLNPSRLPGFKTTFLQALVSSELFRARGGYYSFCRKRTYVRTHLPAVYFTCGCCTRSLDRQLHVQ